MAQTPQAGETGATETPPPAGGQVGGLFSNPTTWLLVALLLGYIVWTRRKRTEMEARLQAQRREREESAQQSAMNVAHIMRRPASPESSAAAASEGLAAAASEGLASAARTPAAAPAGADEERARVMERAEATAEAERAAEEQAARAAEAAGLAGPSVARRAAAAEAAAEEARADTADALQSEAAQDAGSTDRAAMRGARSAIPVPTGAVAGDGTDICPADYPVKGNASSRIYHVPGQVSYPPTIAEFCFASAETAEAAGFRQSRARQRAGN